MDPNACLQRAFDLIADGEMEDAFYALLDLQGWIGKGGFAPDGCTPQEILGFVMVAKRLCKMKHWDTGDA